MKKKEKKELINDALKEPLRFEEDGKFKILLEKNTKLKFSDLREMIKRIYNMNESSLLEQSDASSGKLGELNQKSTEKRTKKYYKKIDRNFRDPDNKTNKVILSEGDSWFQFPIDVKDIIDWLVKKHNYAIYSIAYGGDWITNIIYEGTYIEELSVHTPDVFLMSGGGNDMVGGNKIAVMVSKDQQKNTKYKSVKELDRFEELTDTDRQEIFEGQKYLLKEFHSFLITIKAQYYLILHSISRSDLTDMMIITQGYDYAIPSLKNRFSLRYPLQYFINAFVDTGKWLARPMLIRGITNKETQRKIIKAMIFEFNEMLKGIADKFPNVYHIDCRGVAKGKKDWYDELHLKSHKFQKVAEVYSMLINGEIKDKNVIRVVDYVN